MIERVLIRTDASSRIGTGHVMRCLALAEICQRSGAKVTFVMAESTSAIEETIRSRGCEVTSSKALPGTSEDAGETIAVAQASKTNWVVADGYHFGSAFQKQIKDGGQILMMLDDYGQAERYFADLVLNQNLGAKPDLYCEREVSTRLLLGTRYCLLSREFLRWRTWERKIPARAEDLLITLGGADPDNVTVKVIEAIKLLAVNSALVVVGGSNPHLKSLRAAAAGRRVQLVVNASNMPDLMARADVAIAAGGTTAWELAFMGLPSLTIVLAPNQRRNADQLQGHGVTRSLGWHADLSPDDIARALDDLVQNAHSRLEMSRHGRALVDGLGAFRVWLHLNEDTLVLRSAGESDSRQIWKWASDPEVRAVSFSSEPIPWESHVEWFRAKLTDPNSRFWIATNNLDQDVGQVRFDLGANEAAISVSLDSAQRGKGAGALLIWSACRRLLRETGVEWIDAYVKPDNVASARVFEKAGFERIANAMIKRCEALHFRFTRANSES